MVTYGESIETAKTAGEAAAIWWVASLVNPQADGNISDLPSGTSQTFKHSSFMSVRSLKRFKKILSTQVNKKLKHPDHLSADGLVLSVDYYPRFLLEEWSRKAKLITLLGDWPWGYRMLINSTEVVVQYGRHGHKYAIWRGQTRAEHVDVS